MSSIGLTLGAMIGFGIWTLLALIAIPIIIGGIIFYRKDPYGSVGGDVATFFAAILVGWSAIMGLVLIPWNSTYWQLWQIEGRATSISNVIAESDGDLTREPVVTISGFDHPVVVEDPRIVGYKDQDITLNCVKSWHFRAEDTYRCRINSLPEARS